MLDRNEASEITGGPRSQTSWAYEAIRRDILSGRHTPDKKLKIQDLAEDLGVSPGAVREALSRLVPEQLVVSRDQRGFAVAPLSIEDLEDLTELRCHIEAIALRQSVTRGGFNWEAEVLAAAHRLRSVAQPKSYDDLEAKGDWLALHADFHAALISACGSRRLINLHAQLYEQSERYRRLSVHLDSARDIADEHQQIVNMALARDADGLVEATVSHIRKTTEMIVAAERGRTAAAA